MQGGEGEEEMQGAVVQDGEKEVVVTWERGADTSAATLGSTCEGKVVKKGLVMSSAVLVIYRVSHDTGHLEVPGPRPFINMNRTPDYFLSA